MILTVGSLIALDKICSGGPPNVEYKPPEQVLTNPMNLGQALADYMARLAVLLAVKCW